MLQGQDRSLQWWCLCCIVFEMDLVCAPFLSWLSLVRSAKDVCDYYVRINIQFKCDDLLVGEHDHLLMEKETHLDAAIGQRHMVSNFVKKFV